MPKLRNATSDVGKMAQYLARKCVIHMPQAELDMSADDLKSKSQRFGTNKHYKGSEVHMLRDEDSHQFVAISPGGRAMLVSVEEVNVEELDKDTFQKVGS